jgi:hypothetical protein
MVPAAVDTTAAVAAHAIKLQMASRRVTTRAADHLAGNLCRSGLDGQARAD